MHTFLYVLLALSCDDKRSHQRSPSARERAFNPRWLGPSALPSRTDNKPLLHYLELLVVGLPSVARVSCAPAVRPRFLASRDASVSIDRPRTGGTAVDGGGVYVHKEHRSRE